MVLKISLYNQIKFQHVSMGAATIIRQRPSLGNVNFIG
jgi:hypothetical protein